MKQIKHLMALILMALSPFALSAADHIVFIHGWQMFEKDRYDTWDNMISLMVDADNGVPFIGENKILNIQHGKIDKSIEEVARYVWGEIDKGFPDGTKPNKMDFVVHSMGGLILRSLVDQGLLPDSRIGRVVTLATPHYGQKMCFSEQQENMEYGSQFIWQLANSSKKITPSKILCVVSTDDSVVSEWSAALQEKDCKAIRYVNKTHTLTDAGICKCSEGRKDPVYQLVTSFLSDGAIPSEGALYGKSDRGAILYQVVDGKGRPVAYERNSFYGIAAAIKTIDGMEVDYCDYSPNASLSEKFVDSHTRGIGAIVNRRIKTETTFSIELDRGMIPGQYFCSIHFWADSGQARTYYSCSDTCRECPSS